MGWFALYFGCMIATIAIVGWLDATWGVPWNESSTEGDSAVPKVLIIMFWPVALAVLIVWAVFVLPYRYGRFIGGE